MDNTEARRNWTGGAQGWLHSDAVFDELFAPVTEAIIDAAAPRPGDFVLEVGCGSGALLERSAAQGARTVGIDISPGMIDAARARVPEATLVVGDAQSFDLCRPSRGHAYDVVLSRFGLMFFADPVTAFANLRRATTGNNGMLAFACWGRRDENPMFTLGTDALARRLESEGAAAAPIGPGPTALADPARIREVIEGAGWSGLHLERLDFECAYGMDGSDGVEERLAVVLGTTTGRRAAEVLQPLLGPSGWAGLVAEVRAEIVASLHTGSSMVRHPATAWLVTAANRRRTAGAVA